MSSPFRLLIGLGNPGPRYAGTRHNIGFLVIDRYASARSASWEASRQGHARVARCGEVWLMKPETFMNRSGEAVAAFTRFHKITAEEILLVFDDLDLPAGKLRLRDGGGSAGHRGVSSVCENLGTKQVARLRFGIGRPAGRIAIEDFVLQDFGPEEWHDAIVPAIERACEALACTMTSGFETAKNQFNPQTQPS